MADAPVLEAGARNGRAGSSPVSGTKFRLQICPCSLIVEHRTYKPGNGTRLVYGVGAEPARGTKF